MVSGEIWRLNKDRRGNETKDETQSDPCDLPRILSPEPLHNLELMIRHAALI